MTIAQQLGYPDHGQKKRARGLARSGGISYANALKIIMQQDGPKDTPVPAPAEKKD